MTDTVLVFELNGFRLGLDAAYAVAIHQLPALAPAPLMPAYVAGLCNLRGSVVPVVNLATLWKLEQQEPYPCMILLRRGDDEIALMVSRVVETQNRAAALEGGGNAENGFNGYIQALLPDQTAVLNVDLLLGAVFQRTEV